MPTSAPGNSRPGCSRGAWLCRAAARGFTIIELLIVIAIVAVASAVVSWAVPDGDATRLEEEAARLGALLDLGRAEARVSGVAVRWVPRADDAPAATADGQPLQFRFVGLPAALAMPTRWLDTRVRAQVVGSPVVVLGPDAILPPQRIVLSLGAKRLELHSDGLGPFAVVRDSVDPTAAQATPP